MIDGEPGDLKFYIRQPFDARWERRGHDLLINETISLVDALTGFTREIEHLDGHMVKLGATVSGEVGREVGGMDGGCPR
jgi:DnaJ family protein B protein 11